MDSTGDAFFYTSAARAARSLSFFAAKRSRTIIRSCGLNFFSTARNLGFGEPVGEGVIGNSFAIPSIVSQGLQLIKFNIIAEGSPPTPKLFELQQHCQRALKLPIKMRFVA